MGLLIRTISPSAQSTLIKFNDVDANLIYLDDTITTFSASYIIDSASFDGRFTTFSASYVTDSSSFNTRINSKANLNGGNNFTGDQYVTGIVQATKVDAVEVVTAPIYQGYQTKIIVGQNETQPLLQFSSSLYSSLIVDLYIVGQTELTYYGLLTLYVIIDPSNPDVIYTSFDNTVTSPAAVGTQGEGGSAPNTFNPTNLIFSANLISATVVELRVTNECLKSDQSTPLGPIIIKTIVRAFTVL
jgi:hypothetical protein